jgi:excisionase family DNA binding protein
MNTDELLTVAEVAERLRISRLTVRRRIADGQIPAVRLGGRGTPIRVAASELEDWLTRQRLSVSVDDGSPVGDSFAPTRSPAERRAPGNPAVEVPAHAGQTKGEKHEPH